MSPRGLYKRLSQTAVITAGNCIKEDSDMIDTLLVAATVKAFEDILEKRGVPYETRKDDEYKIYMAAWDEAGKDAQVLALRQAAPAAERIASKEAYLFETGGEPLAIRLNYLTRKLDKDSFGEILLERTDIDWHICISVKNDAKVLSSMTLADRTRYTEKNRVINVFNEIDDFGEEIFQVPCSNEYFNDVNKVLLTFEPYSKEEWVKKLDDEDFLYGKLITPMLRAIAAEVPRICEYHPEAPKKFIDFFYGNFDYYFIKPIKELEITRIGSVNSHGDLGKIPGSHNLAIQRINFPTKLLDVRFATGDYGEISKDTLQFSFDGGWAVCLKLHLDEEHLDERNFMVSVYLPVTPFGSYRDQVAWG